MPARYTSVQLGERGVQCVEGRVRSADTKRSRYVVAGASSQTSLKTWENGQKARHSTESTTKETMSRVIAGGPLHQSKPTIGDQSGPFREDDDELVQEIAPVVVADLVPTQDQEQPTATYLSYDKSRTRIVTYAIGSSYPGIYAENIQVARLHCQRLYGQILETNTVPGRAFFRVMQGVKEA